MEPALSTLSEIAANLLKRERAIDGSGVDIIPASMMGWEQLMALSKETDVLKWQAALNKLIADNPGKRRVTVMRVIQGGLA
jgi:sulfur carrier protein ThiS